MSLAGSSYRVFFALPVGAELREQLHRLAQELALRFPGVKWVAPDHYHLTLRFLGEMPASRVEKLVTCLQKASWPTAFLLPLGEIGGFPKDHRARIIKLEATNRSLEDLYAQLEARLGAQGLPAGEGLSGHLTLGRTRRGETVRLTGLAPACARSSLTPLQVERMVLYRSQLRPQGPLYSELASFALGLPGQTPS